MCHRVSLLLFVIFVCLSSLISLQMKLDNSTEVKYNNPDELTTPELTLSQKNDTTQNNTNVKVLKIKFGPVNNSTLKTTLSTPQSNQNLTFDSAKNQTTQGKRSKLNKTTRRFTSNKSNRTTKSKFNQETTKTILNLDLPPNNSSINKQDWIPALIPTKSAINLKLNESGNETVFNYTSVYVENPAITENSSAKIIQYSPAGNKTVSNWSSLFIEIPINDKTSSATTTTTLRTPARNKTDLDSTFWLIEIPKTIENSSATIPDPSPDGNTTNLNSSSLFVEVPAMTENSLPSIIPESPDGNTSANLNCTLNDTDCRTSLSKTFMDQKLSAVNEVLDFLSSYVMFLKGDLNSNESLENLETNLYKFSNKTLARLKVIKDTWKKVTNFQTNSTSNNSYDFSQFFDKSVDYKGPIVEGWPPSMTRSMPKYIQPNNDATFLTRPNLTFYNSCKIIVVVHSAPDSFETRQVIRETWGKYVRQNISTCLTFCIGKVQSNSSELFNSTLNDEISLFGDMIVVDLIDHYNNLTLKTMHMLKYFLNCSNFVEQNDTKNCPKLLFKSDDDTFVNLPRLSQVLLDQDDSSFAMGFVFNNKNHLKRHDIPESEMNKTFSGKWITPKYMFKGDFFPSFISGSGYAISRSASECLYKEGLKIPFFHLEDVYLTGFAAEICKVRLEHSDMFYPYLPGNHIYNSEEIFFHYVDNSQKRELYEKFSLM